MKPLHCALKHAKLATNTETLGLQADPYAKAHKRAQTYYFVTLKSLELTLTYCHYVS
jgi:hypothetical protein